MCDDLLITYCCGLYGICLVLFAPEVYGIMNTNEILAFHEKFLRRESLSDAFLDAIEKSWKDIVNTTISRAIEGDNKCLTIVLDFATTRDRAYDEEIARMRSRLYFEYVTRGQKLPKPLNQMSVVELIEETRKIIEKFDGSRIP